MEILYPCKTDNDIQQISRLMHLKAIPVDSFFQTVNSHSLTDLESEVVELEAYFSQDRNFTNTHKISLTENYLLLSSKVHSSFSYTHYLPITPALKFQKIINQTQNENNCQSCLGFRFVNSDKESVSIYIQFPELIKLWIAWLTRNLTQLDFHLYYKIIGRIGKGTTASVLQVERLADGKKFAAKAFHKEYISMKKERLQSLQNEINLLRALDHPNILKIQSVLQSETSIYLISEMLSGGNIIERINKQKGFNQSQVKEIMSGILQGLKYLHKFDIAHRDLKLENVIFRDGTNFEPVIADFGLAVVADDEPYAFYRCGTPGYVAPEIIRMKQNCKVNVSCDIFSAGVIFHLLLTNKYLFEGTNSQQIYKKNLMAQINLEGDRYKILDSSALSLMKKMLVVRGRERISAQQALEEEFLALRVLKECEQKQGISPAVTQAGEMWHI